eukprot:symbB.v1.2.042101.t1/scaffold9241.1/size3826/1
MPPGLSDEEALKWQMQTLGAQLRSEAVERAREQAGFWELPCWLMEWEHDLLKVADI